MLVHTFSTPRLPKQGAQTYLSVTVGLMMSCLAVSAQAANSDSSVTELPVVTATTPNTSISSTQTVHKRLKYPNAPVNNGASVSEELLAVQTYLFFECTQVQSGAARLACFDKVSKQGEIPSHTTTKQPVDIVKTLQSTISGNPQVVLAENVTPINGDTAIEADTVVVSSQPIAPEYLDNGKVKTDAQILENVGVTQNDIEKYTPLSLAYDLDKNNERGTWSARPHRPMYVLPLFYSTNPNRNPSTPSQEEVDFTSDEMRNTELKLQVSIKTKVAEDLFGTSADMWFGYSQLSHWQVYNQKNSRPFRATDYEPEVFITQPVKANLPFGGRLRMLGVGASHHSNGQSDPLSRSWNRAYVMGGAEWGKFAILPRIWSRISTENDDSDDNPDIEDFMGHGDVTFLYDLPNKQSLSGTLRYNHKTEKGAVQLDYVYPLSHNVNGYLQLFRGYGESIIDYNQKNTAIGVGIMLNDWKGL